MPLLHMIGTIASITGAITIVAPVRHNGSSIVDKFKKGGAGGSPLLPMYCIVTEAR